MRIRIIDSVSGKYLETIIRRGFQDSSTIGTFTVDDEEQSSCTFFREDRYNLEGELISVKIKGEYEFPNKVTFELGCIDLVDSSNSYFIYNQDYHIQMDDKDLVPSQIAIKICNNTWLFNVYGEKVKVSILEDEHGLSIGIYKNTKLGPLVFIAYYIEIFKARHTDFIESIESAMNKKLIEDGLKCTVVLKSSDTLHVSVCNVLNQVPSMGFDIVFAGSCSKATNFNNITQKEVSSILSSCFPEETFLYDK